MKISEFNIARDLNRVLKLLKGEDEISECFRNAAESDHASIYIAEEIPRHR
ncbi:MULTISPECIES: hypothetical protein [Tissierellales]|jgi:hypothetical protein|uniref:hypothetical protein n=1 Tax=Tissierellales TaxID=1737405 RepID=UPI00089F9657|nr:MULTISPECIES: hypothetical protein [Tissierellales]SCL90488.1 hypothetical protein PP176A_1981 [Sporanaerobacter sp. PP17-6a]